MVAAPEDRAAVPTAAAEMFAATTALAARIEEFTDPEASAAKPTAPASIFAATTDAAPSLSEVTEPLMRLAVSTEVALRWVELMLPATMETVDVPDAVDTDAGDVPMTALT